MILKSTPEVSSIEQTEVQFDSQSTFKQTNPIFARKRNRQYSKQPNLSFS